MIGYASIVLMLLPAQIAYAQDGDAIDPPAEAPRPEEPVTSPPPAPAPDNDLPDIDLEAPLQDFDNFGVAWPEFDAPQKEDGALGDADIETGTEIIAEADAGAEAAAENATATANALADIEEQQSAFFDNPLRVNIEDYDIALSFTDDLLADGVRGDLLDRFNALSSLEQLNSDDSNIAQLRRRSNRDRELLLRLLRIYGHYDGIVEPIFEAPVVSASAGAGTSKGASLDGATSADDLSVNFAITAGPLYRLSNINLGALRQTGGDFPYLRGAFGVAVDDPVNSDDIVAGENRLAEALAENGYAFAEIAPPELVIDHQARGGDLTLFVEPGEKYRFGNINVGDDPLLSARHLLRIARFASGDVFRASRVEDLRRAILATGLASAVSITPVPADGEAPATGDDPPRPGAASKLASEPATETVDLNIDIAAAPLRTVAGELGFGTGEGFRVAASWEHRNFFPPEGLVRVRGVLGTQEQLLGATYQRNNFRMRDTVLNINALVSNVQRDAFDARTISLSANIQRQTNLIFQKKWTWSAGVEFVLTDESDIAGPNAEGRETFGIVAAPVSLAYDGSDDLLNPRKGFRISALASPEVSLISGNVAYVRSQVDASFYQPVSERVVVAGRTRLALTSGANTFSIAPSRRFYSGGGGSVRGFGFQDIGPIDINGDPVGGRSLAEFSLEARIRFGDIGVVPFIDAGNVYDSSFPGFGGLRYGAGIGLRYYSSFGPLRLDIGTPINPGPGDAAIGVYVSLGQAF